MTVFSIDPGLARVGWAIIELKEGCLKLLECGLLQTPSDKSIQERLSLIHSGMMELTSHHKIDHIAIEELFFTKNVKTAIDVAQARGVLMMLGHYLNVPVFEYTPKEVKTAVTSFGGADKYQVGQMVKMLLGLPEIPTPDDVSDACAIGICHLFTVR